MKTLKKVVAHNRADLNAILKNKPTALWVKNPNGGFVVEFWV